MEIDIRFELLDLVLRVAVVPLLAGPLLAVVLLLQLLTGGAGAASTLHVVAAGLVLHRELILPLAMHVALARSRMLLLLLAMVLILLLMKNRKLMLVLPIHQVLHCTGVLNCSFIQESRLVKAKKRKERNYFY
jgi:hypothetical protein